LTIGHSAGLSNIIVPGAGEPNFDSAEADPFENKKARREKEVKALLDKVCYPFRPHLALFLTFHSPQIQPDMITLDPEFVGSLAPPSKLTTVTTIDGKPPVAIPFARLPRLERLKLSGKADETEENGDEEDLDDNGKKESREERERRRQRGKGKSLKRYLRKQRKNVIDPTAVAIRKKLEKQREEKERARLAAKSGSEEPRKPSALDRFKRVP